MNEKAPLKCGVSGSGDFDLYCNFPVTKGTVELPGAGRADGYCAGKGLSERSAKRIFLKKNKKKVGKKFGGTRK